MKIVSCWESTDLLLRKAWMTISSTTWKSTTWRSTPLATTNCAKTTWNKSCQLVRCKNGRSWRCKTSWRCITTIEDVRRSSSSSRCMSRTSKTTKRLTSRSRDYSSKSTKINDWFLCSLFWRDCKQRTVRTIVIFNNLLFWFSLHFSGKLDFFGSFKTFDCSWWNIFKLYLKWTSSVTSSTKIKSTMTRAIPSTKN